MFFDNPEAAKHFISWLCGSGEQQYWDWMMVREKEEDGNITALNFDYWGGTEDGEEFAKHPITTKCGRLSK
jgi:ABC-type Fe3+ transport system substrate-binding protein